MEVKNVLKLELVNKFYDKIVDIFSKQTELIQLVATEDLR